ncbi:hypothetical protein ZWY2020_050978 [Hordeum vulgare]|nr:hypothetical protein ZWY2020_050978 [Hordeum vulgare]
MRHGGRRARGLLMHAWMHARGVSVARSDADKDDVSAAHLSPPGGATSAPAQQQHTCTLGTRRTISEESARSRRRCRGGIIHAAPPPAPAGWRASVRAPPPGMGPFSAHPAWAPCR